MSFQPTDIMRINNAHNVAGNTSANHNAGLVPNNMGGNPGSNQGNNGYGPTSPTWTTRR